MFCCTPPPPPSSPPPSPPRPSTHTTPPHPPTTHHAHLLHPPPPCSGRMDSYVDQFMAAGGSFVTLAKGNRSKAVTNACKKHGGFYLGSIGEGQAGRRAGGGGAGRRRRKAPQGGWGRHWQRRHRSHWQRRSQVKLCSLCAARRWVCAVRRPSQAALCIATHTCTKTHARTFKRPTHASSPNPLRPPTPLVAAPPLAPRWPRRHPRPELHQEGGQGQGGAPGLPHASCRALAGGAGACGRSHRAAAAGVTNAAARRAGRKRHRTPHASVAAACLAEIVSRALKC